MYSGDSRRSAETVRKVGLSIAMETPFLANETVALKSGELVTVREIPVKVERYVFEEKPLGKIPAAI